MPDDARTEARLRFVQALVDHRLVGAYEAGDEHLGTWEQVWPEANRD